MQNISLFFLRLMRLAKLHGLLWASFVSEICTALSTRSETSIREIISGQDNERTCRDLVVFAHYDQQGIIDPHVLHYLEALKETGREIILTSSAAALEEPGLTAAKCICREIVHRHNRGYDFGSFKTGIVRAGDLTQYDSLIIANDSVFGPVTSLSQTISEMRAEGFDFWGMTDSLEGGQHVQSYFVFFEKAVLHSREFRAFWKNFPLYKNKLSVIREGEIGLSKRLRQAGFRYSAVVSSNKVQAKYPELFEFTKKHSSGGNPNISRLFWRQLIEDFRFPFLKVEIVRDLAEVAPGIEAWRDVLKASTEYDVGLIERYLQRIGKSD